MVELLVLKIMAATSWLCTEQEDENDQLLLQEIKGENGIDKEEMGMFQSHEDDGVSKLEFQMEEKQEETEESKGDFEAMEAYKKWVRRNKDYVHSLDSLANGLTWLLPERFSDSEIGPEAGFVKLWHIITAILGIITAINEHVIDTTQAQMHAGPVERNSFPYSLCISAIKDLETLVEVAAQHYYGNDKKWNFIAVTEATKVLVRLALFRNSGYKMLLHGGETSNIEKHSDFSSLQHNDRVFPKRGPHNGSNGQSPWNLEGRALSALSRFGENARMGSDPVWLRRVQHQQAIMEPPPPVIERPTLSAILSEKGVRGHYFSWERKYGIRSWIPWFLSLAVDTIGVGFLTHVTQSRDGGKEQHFHLTAAEKDELKRRKLLWALYLMRDPFFSKYTWQRLDSTEKLLEPVPIVGLLTAKIVELVVGAQTRYTYMSGS
ncbi:unnamed protein product [Dovyalis caffra]|uniref:Peroxisomal membrane protein PEX16 n=1 Tax=Dovyalis caffra TaxID=77055 RepID=A0AAV1SAN2_9ROSI|nr:unnamed protein product [Dovyalis caffra]